MVSRNSAGHRGYTTVAPNGSPSYVAPFEPSCPASRRYMAVHRVAGGGWGIVDRRTGRLLEGNRPDQHRYPSWHEVQTAVSGLNGPGPS
jgi:hypothetical protein